MLIYTSLLSCRYANRKVKGEAQLSHLIRWYFKDTPQEDTWFHLINSALLLVGFSTKIFKAHWYLGLKHEDTQTKNMVQHTRQTS